MFLHRNSQKRIYKEGLIYFITTNTYHGFEYFREPMFCDLLVENLRFCKKLKQFELYAFCILYNHMHLLMKPGKKYNISMIMQFLKRHFSRDMEYILNPEGAIRESRLRGGKYERFSKIINSHDKKLKNIKYQFTRKYGQNQIMFPPFKWQKSYHDHVIRGPRDFINHYHYSVYNFQKHGLLNNWQYTSLKYSDLIDEIEL